MPSPRPPLPELERTKVTLPWDSFRSLLPPPPDPDAGAPPVPWSIARAEYVADLREEHARVTATFEVVVLQAEGWVMIPLLAGGEVSLQSATIDGEPTRLAPTGSRLGVALHEAGRHSVSVEFLAALRGDEPRARTLSFATPRSPVTLLTARGLRRDVIPACRPGFGLELSDEEDGVRVGRVAFPATSTITLSWRPAAERLEPRRPCLIGGAVHTRIAVTERCLALTSRIELAVTGSPAAGVDLLVPAGFQLHAAEGDAVRDARPDTDRVRVRFAHDLLGDAVLTLRGEVPLPDGEAQTQAPVVSLPDGPRSRGTVGVEADPRVEVEVVGCEGAARIDPSELTWNPSGRPTLLAFKFVRARPRIDLGLKTHKDAPVLVATCDHAHYRVLVLEEGKVLVKGHLLVRNNARSFLTLGLPSGAEPWSAYCGGHPARLAGTPEATLVPLLRGSESAFEVEVAYVQRLAPLGDQGQATLRLPDLDLPATYLSAAVFLPRRYRHFNFGGTLRRAEAFMRGFVPPAAPAPAQPWARNVMTQGFVRPRGASQGGGLGGEGQLPIRTPGVERGVLHRFEATLIMGGDAPEVSWEFKRRRRGGNA